MPTAAPSTAPSSPCRRCRRTQFRTDPQTVRLLSALAEQPDCPARRWVQALLEHGETVADRPAAPRDDPPAA
jgi:hypothetical protein